jgi:Initiator Replication protein
LRFVTVLFIFVGMKATQLIPKPPSPTGNPWLFSHDDPATVPIPVPVIIVGVEGPYTEQDRKLWVFLLHAVWDALDYKAVHEVQIRDINGRFRKRNRAEDKRQKGGRHHSDWIWESATRLADTRVRWIRTDGDKRYKGIGRLLSAETDEEAQEGGVLRFSFDPLLVPILKDPRRFARLRTHFMIDLSGKYTVTLYELLESVANKEEPVLQASIEDLRHWLKVPEGKLSRWQDFRRRVLEPAVDQINDEPTNGAGFTVQYTLRKEGRAFRGVRFELEKTSARLKMEQELRDRERQLALPFTEENAAVIDAQFSPLPEAPPAVDAPPSEDTGSGPAVTSLLIEAGLSQRDAGKIGRVRWDYVDVDARPAEASEASFEPYIREKIDLLQRQDKAPRSRMGFLLKAIRENWANPDFAEREKKAVENQAFLQKMANERKQEKLKEEKERILQERDHKKHPICEALLTPPLADALRDELVERGHYNKSWIDHHLTALENYRNGGWFAMAMDSALEERFPERFQAINDAYQARLDALDAQITALG